MAKLRPYLVLPGVLLASALAGGFFGPKLAAVTADDNESEIKADLAAFSRVYDVVQTNYAVPVQADVAVYDGMIPAMLHTLDPHSNFYDPKAFARLREDQEGRYYGVGMLVGPRTASDMHTSVIQVFENTPAYDAGLRPNDMIMAVDNKSTDGLTTDDIARMLKGPKGTTVHVYVHRTGHAQNLDFALTRKEIQHNSVDSSYDISPGVLYLNLTGFTETSTDEIKQIMDKEGALKGMVLDLRGNGGGIVKQAVSIGDIFLAKDQVFVSDHGRASPEEVLKAENGNGGHDFPLVVMVDNMTASAAEMLSGAIQDHDRGLIVGQTTFGKGLVQTVMPLHDNTGLALTSAHYYTPSGRLIQRPYEGVSAYDYFWVHNQSATPPANHEVKLTDTGRTVYGGGGITPDIQIPPLVPNDFQVMLGDRNSFSDFSDMYLGEHNTVPKGWVPDDAVMKEFDAFLVKQNLTLKPADFTTNQTWIRQSIQFTVLSTLYGRNYALSVLMRQDPEVARAVALLPQAAALETKARQVLAARQAPAKP